MQRTPHIAAILTSIAASFATLTLALAPALSLANAEPAPRVVELPRVVVTAAKTPMAPQVVELQRVVVSAQRLAAPVATGAGLAQPLQPVMARQPS